MGLLRVGIGMAWAVLVTSGLAACGGAAGSQPGGLSTATLAAPSAPTAVALRPSTASPPAPTTAPTSVAPAPAQPSVTGAARGIPSPLATATPPASTTPTPTATVTPTASPTATATPTPSAMSMAREMFAAINAARATSPPVTPAFGQSATPVPTRPLDWDDRLAAVALAHAKDMATKDYLSHTNKEGKQPADRLRDAGIEFLPGLANENIYQAFGDGAMQQAMDWFMHDPLHRDVILNPRYNRVGIGVYEVNQKVYFVQVFIAAP